jgi:hypothetical protein
VRDTDVTTVLREQHAGIRQALVRAGEEERAKRAGRGPAGMSCCEEILRYCAAAWFIDRITR